MSGHRKFSQLIENFSDERKVLITQKTAQLKGELDIIARFPDVQVKINNFSELNRDDG